MESNRGTLWKQENPERAKQIWKNCYENNKESIKARNKAWLEAHPEYTMWQRCRSRAKRTGLEFNIEVSDIVIPELCPYLGIPISVGNGASVDRIDNTKGYIKGNIEIISRKANTMKNNASFRELVSFAMRVLETETFLKAQE